VAVPVAIGCARPDRDAIDEEAKRLPRQRRSAIGLGQNRRQRDGLEVWPVTSATAIAVGMARITVKPPATLADCPSGFSTSTEREPIVASIDRSKTALTLVGLMYVVVMGPDPVTRQGPL